VMTQLSKTKRLADRKWPCLSLAVYVLLSLLHNAQLDVLAWSRITVMLHRDQTLINVTSGETPTVAIPSKNNSLLRMMA
jgi:hypothetical protein